MNGTCQTCYSGYYINGTGCVPNGINCAIATPTTGVCIQCSPGFFQFDAEPDRTICTGSIPNCQLVTIAPVSRIPNC